MIPPRRRITAATPPVIASSISTPSESHIHVSDTNPKVVSNTGSQLDPSALDARMNNLTMSNVENQIAPEAENGGVQLKQVRGRRKVKKDGPTVINKQTRRSTRINTNN